eukprot:COSAG02_NODE_1104_length_14560_cov_5.927322_7_plen_121_part_00
MCVHRNDSVQTECIGCADQQTATTVQREPSLLVATSPNLLWQLRAPTLTDAGVRLLYADGCRRMLYACYTPALTHVDPRARAMDAGLPAISIRICSWATIDPRGLHFMHVPVGSYYMYPG